MNQKQIQARNARAPWRKAAFAAISLLYLALIYGTPALLLSLLLRAWPASLWQLGCAFAGPVLYSVGFLVTAGCLSLYHQHAIVPGRFPRDTAHPVYFHRRLYGLCWTALFYCKPVYSLCLAVPLLKRLMFRLFGYRGGMNFTVYPDSWIRDLPLLRFGDGVYISNRATLGTNIALASGHILVDRIELEDGAMVGHLAMLAPGVRLGRRAEIAVGCAIGIGSVIGDGAKVLPTCTVEHGVVMSARAVAGTMSYLGNKAFIGQGVQLAPGTLLTRRSIVTSRHDADAYISSTTRISGTLASAEALDDE